MEDPLRKFFMKSSFPRSFATIFALATLVLNPGHGQETTTGVFESADDLDFTTDDGGTFLYAVNVGGPSVTVQDVVFSADADAGNPGAGIPGLTLVAQNHILGWGGRNEMGNTPDADALEEILHSIRWSARPASVNITMENLVPGGEYRLQLLFAEKCCDRAWDIFVNGDLIVDDFSANGLAGQNPALGTYAAHVFVATSSTLEVVLDGTDSVRPDGNAILDGFTLKQMEISNDDPNILAPRNVRYGQVPASPVSTASFNLRNGGVANSLTVSSISFTGDGAAHFSVPSLPGPIAPGEVTAVEVVFDAMGQAGGFFAEMEIHSNDPGDPILTVEVSANVVNRNGPAARYPLDDDPGSSTMRDVSGNDRPGTFMDSGGLTLGVPGIATGTALQTAGNDFAVIQGSQFDGAFDSFTISSWIRADSVSEPNQVIFGKGADNPSFALLMSDNTLVWFVLTDLQAEPEFNTAGVIEAGTDHHVAVTYNNETGQRRAVIYVDGVEVAAKDDPFVLMDTPGDPFYLGSYGGALGFTGVIDDLHIYDRVASAADIAFLFNNPGESLGSTGPIDSDGDGLSDEEEATLGTDPLNADTDGDGLSDGAEVNIHGTDPLLRDTDGDLASDGVEIAKGSDPLDPADVPASFMEISTFTGGDPGEGLDFEGTFVYAVNVGGPSVVVGNAVFSADTAPGAPGQGIAGVTMAAQNHIPNWHTANYGDSPDDNGLETVVQSIRWSAAPEDPMVTLANLIPGQRYALQLLFAESCCNRGYDLVINDVVEADDFNPGVVQGGINNPTQGAVATYMFTAQDSQLHIVLSNDDVAAGFPDTNPILNGFTLKLLPGDENDADGDGLPDTWEILHFGNIAAHDGSGDPDGDGLDNAAELDANTNPTNPDTDGDGINDGDEIAGGTDPLNRDTDGDGCYDGSELLVFGTDPLNPDSDGDGFTDCTEILFDSDPNDAGSVPVVEALVTTFTGGDAGEGIDFDGDFAYAINMRGDGGFSIRDAAFTDDSVAGFNWDQVHEIIAWHAPEYGDSPNDNNLETVMQSIRWTDGTVNMSLGGLEPGEFYKLQLLFAESCCNRGWDIRLQGALVLDDFNVQIVQGGINVTTQGVLVTVVVRAPGNALDIQFLREAPQFPDNNPILNGLTLERVGSLDSDGDGLPDSWEVIHFGNLDQGADDDPDGDGLTNAEELALLTNPAQADTDGDGLNDGDERDANTDPLLPDTDGDGLNDGAEVHIHGTDPNDPDTDGDGFPDGVEVAKGSDPLDPNDIPDSATVISSFTGGDPGEGLDFQGTFQYAVDVGGPGGVQIGDAVFTTDDVAGVVITAVNLSPAWNAPNYGDTAADDALESLTRDIRWSPAPEDVFVTIGNLTVGQRYALQLIFHEACCNRGFDILIDGILEANEFNPGVVQGGVPNPGMGAVATYTFTAQATELEVVLSNDDITSGFPDTNPILNALTLEVLGDVVPTGDADGDGFSDEEEALAGTDPNDPADYLHAVSTGRTAGGVELTWSSKDTRSYEILYSPTMNPGTWEVIATVPGAAGTTTFEDTDAGRTGAEEGYYRAKAVAPGE